MQKISLFILTGLLSQSTLFAQKVNQFSVKQTVDYGLKNSVQVKNALVDIKIQQQTNREFTANAYPQLNASVGLTDYINIPTSLIPAEFFGGPAGTYQPVKFGTKYNANGSADISQILFDGQVFVGLKARSTAMNLASKTAEVTQEQIKANIYKIYYQLVVGKKQLASIDANIDRFSKLLHDTKEIFKNGFAEKLDVDKVQVTLSNLTTEKEKVQNQLEVGNAGLKFLINMPQKEVLELSDTLSEDEIKSNLLDTAYKYEDRKEIQLLNLAAKLSNYNVKRYELSRLPSIAAFGSYSKNAQREKFNFFGKGDWFTTSLVGVKMNIPIFDGFARRARIESAKLAVEKLKNNIDATKESIDFDVASARIKMKSALLTMDAQKQNIDLAEKVYNTTKKKYEQGLGTNQEIYNAQTELKVAQTNYYGSLYDAISAKIDWLKAVGKL